MNMGRIKAETFALSLLIVLSVHARAIAERTIQAEDLYDKMRGMWLGQLIGNAAGRETEGKYSSTPNPNNSVPWVIKPEWDADDDTDIEYLALHILETNGFDCNSHQIAAQWRSHITTSGIYIANRQAWYLMGDGRLPPNTGSQTYNQHWYSIDSQITTETLGAVSPGLAQTAIDLTAKFAHITNTGFPVHAAQFYAAMYANAFFEPNVVTLVTQALTAIPTTSRTHQVVTDVLNWYLEDANDGIFNWRPTRYKLHDKYQGLNSYGRYYNWIESTVNTGATVLAILYGQGDFKDTVQIGVLAGWDCDCNPATAGGLIGIIEGFGNLPSDLTDPAVCGDLYKNLYRPYLPDPQQYLPQYDTITGIASRLTILAQRNILDNGGYVTGTGPAATYHIPDDNMIIPEPEKPDPNGPLGLVADALAAGITVTPTAAVQRYNPHKDRENLYSIIDGITDNSYNGHRPYYTYLSDKNARPERHWYQLDFSQPVKFDQVTFYEGDVVWQRINDYYKSGSAKGGFFNDLTVEILRDGRFIQPANLQMDPALDRFKMYQTITFNFAPTVGRAIRIIGTPGGTQAFTTILELQIQGDIDPGLYVTSVRIADGQDQRSNVNKIQVQFSRDVSVTKNDVQLTGTTNGTIDMNRVEFDYDNAAPLLTLFFQSPLPDDAYCLNLDCLAITDANGLTLLDDDHNPDDGSYTIEFHSLFGDADGSATVSLPDLALLALHWFDVPADTGLDANEDNTLNFSDLAAVLQNWLVSL
ncbi:MAG: ADP-ribosylglycohydrolase family protein [Planctomycetes bacterium]|nr:ADP-ribosylglycohydrolase family protein [Planctomycetota bacterium]